MLPIFHFLLWEYRKSRIACQEEMTAVVIDDMKSRMPAGQNKFITILLTYEPLISYTCPANRVFLNKINLKGEKDNVFMEK